MERATFFGELAGILSDREDQYGTPSRLFDEIARIWTVILSFEVEPEQPGAGRGQRRAASSRERS